MQQITKADLEEEIEKLLAYKSIYSVRPVIFRVDCSLLLTTPSPFFPSRPLFWPRFFLGGSESYIYLIPCKRIGYTPPIHT